jgi:ABC-type uncharacterized transport system substrate-binding protein
MFIHIIQDGLGRTMFLKKSFILCALVLSGQLCAAPTQFMEAHKKNYTVAITQYDNEVEYNEAYQGILLGLKAEGFETGKNIIILFENANGDLNRVDQIATEFVAKDPDIIIPISTPSSLAIVKADQNAHIPVVFAAVIEPLVQQDKNVTGVYSFIPVSHGNEEVGYMAGRMAGMVLGGKSPGQLAVVKPADTQLFINSKAADILGK